MREFRASGRQAWQGIASHVLKSCFVRVQRNEHEVLHWIIACQSFSDWNVVHLWWSIWQPIGWYIYTYTLRCSFLSFSFSILFIKIFTPIDISIAIGYAFPQNITILFVNTFSKFLLRYLFRKLDIFCCSRRERRGDYTSDYVRNKNSHDFMTWLSVCLFIYTYSSKFRSTPVKSLTS